MQFNDFHKSLLLLLMLFFLMLGAFIFDKTAFNGCVFNPRPDCNDKRDPEVPECASEGIFLLNYERFNSLEDANGSLEVSSWDTGKVFYCFEGSVENESARCFIKLSDGSEISLRVNGTHCALG